MTQPKAENNHRKMSYYNLPMLDEILIEVGHEDRKDQILKTAANLSIRESYSNST